MWVSTRTACPKNVMTVTKKTQMHAPTHVATRLVVMVMNSKVLKNATTAIVWIPTHARTIVPPHFAAMAAQAPEECDDGNESDEDGRRDDCTRNVCGDGIINPAIEACDEGMNNTDTGACLQSCQVASCGDGFRREDILNPGLDGFEYCDDDEEGEFDGCNSSCEQTEVEPNGNFGDANIILFDRIVGVMEAGQGDRSPGVDTYEFQLNCGVQSGQDCPPSGDVTWNFTLTTPQNLCAAVPIGGRPDCNVRNFEVAAACNGVCAELVELTFERRGRVQPSMKTLLPQPSDGVTWVTARARGRSSSSRTD